MKKPELLAPAGDFSRLKYAVAYGADAVYIGGEHFSLRTASSNFNSEELQKAVRYAHSHQVKVYCAVNAVPRNAEIEEFPSYLKSLCDAGIDAVYRFGYRPCQYDKRIGAGDENSSFHTGERY